jgi:hypothetical protein
MLDTRRIGSCGRPRGRRRPDNHDTGGAVAKNAYTFAKRAKELAKNKKKEEKKQRKPENGVVEEGPYYDEATGQIVYPESAEASASDESAEQDAPGDAEGASPGAAPDKTAG